MRPLNRLSRIRERTHESKNIGGPFEAARHRVYSSVIAWTSDSQPGEPAPAIWLGRPRSPTWFPAGRDNRRGSWTLWVRPSADFGPSPLRGCARKINCAGRRTNVAHRGRSKVGRGKVDGP